MALSKGSWMFAICAAVLLASPVSGQSTAPQEPTDWDLLMLKLVNRARVDPAAENQRHGTSYSNAPVPPLAYSPLLGRAASNHNQWMAANISNPAINDPTNNGPAPDSFTHYETLNAQSSGAAATNTPGYSGASIGTRVTYTGYSWSYAGENIYWRSNTPAIDASLIAINHAGWWNSKGHRDNFMRASYTAFGHDALNTVDHFAAQTLARPLSAVRTYLFGLLYDDLDQSGEWEPRHGNDPKREGVGGVPYRVYSSATGSQVGSDSTTFDNGAFSFLADNGTYDMQFLLGEDDYWIRDVSLSGSNLDLGDLDINATVTQLAGDFNGDGMVNLADYTLWRDNLGADTEAALNGNGNGSGGVDNGDYAIWRDHFVMADLGSTQAASQIPEPGTAVLLLTLVMTCWAIPHR